MLLLRLRVDSFTLAVIARAVNVNGFPCGTMATRRGEIRSVLNPSRFSACIFRHVFANDFATSPVSSLFAYTPAKLMVSGYQNLTNQDKPFGLAPLFPPEMEAKTVHRTTLVLFCSNMADQSDEEYVGVLDGDRCSDTLVPCLTSPSCSTESESEKQADKEVSEILFKWNPKRKLSGSVKEKPVEKKSKIESASVSTEEDVNG